MAMSSTKQQRYQVSGWAIVIGLASMQWWLVLLGLLLAYMVWVLELLYELSRELESVGW